MLQINKRKMENSEMEEPKISYRLGVNKSIRRLPYYFALLLTVFFSFSSRWSLAKKFIKIESLQSQNEQTAIILKLRIRFGSIFCAFSNFFILSRPTFNLAFFRWQSFVCISEMFVSVSSQLSVILIWQWNQECAQQLCEWRKSSPKTALKSLEHKC